MQDAPTVPPSPALARRRVLVTRPEPGASDTAGRLAALGWEPCIAPFLAVAPRAPSLPDPARLQAVLAASGQAVATLPAVLHGLKLLAVGDATAARARAAGFAEAHSADGDAAALAALAARLCDPRGRPLLLAAGAGQGGALTQALRGLGFRVLRRTVYVSAPVTRFPDAATLALAEDRLRAVLFFSRETARAFARTLPAGLRPALAGVEALAIGRPVADAVQDLPWQHIRVAARPRQDEVLALL